MVLKISGGKSSSGMLSGVEVHYVTVVMVQVVCVLNK